MKIWSYNFQFSRYLVVVVIKKAGAKNGQVAAPAWMCAWMTCGMICRAGGELILQESIGNLAADGSFRFAGLLYSIKCGLCMI